MASSTTTYMEDNKENSTSEMNMDSQSSLLSQSSIGMNKFEMFNIFIQNAIEQVASGVSEEEYTRLFGQLSALRNKKSAPSKMQKTMKKNLVESLKKEVDSMVEEENLKKKLERLESLVDKFDNEEGAKAWRPGGNVGDQMRSVRMEAKLRFQQELEESVREREQRTDRIKQEVSLGRAEVRALESRLRALKERSGDTALLRELNEKIEQSAVNINKNN